MSNKEDSYKQKGLRKQLIRDLRDKGIRDERVLDAFDRVPRHYFFDPTFIEFAYEDKAFPIGEGQTISQPFTVAYQTQLLNIKKGDKVLEIGTGSGYQTAILVELGAKVYTVERQKALHEKARLFLPSIGFNAEFVLGDGSRGLPEKAPFDKIIVTAGAPSVPETLIKQMNIGGILVIPVGDSNLQKMVLIGKISETEIKKTELDSFRFVPLIGDNAW